MRQWRTWTMIMGTTLQPGAGRMKTVLAIVFAVLSLACISVHAAAPPPRDVSPRLTPIIQKHDVPGMAAAVVQSGEMAAIGVARVRTRGKPHKVAVTDCLNIGSDTKTMTAMLFGFLADESKPGSGQT